MTADFVTHRPHCQLNVILDLTDSPTMSSTRLGLEVLFEPDTDLLMRRSELQAGKEPSSLVARGPDSSQVLKMPFFPINFNLSSINLPEGTAYEVATELTELVAMKSPNKVLSLIHI